MTKPNFFIVIVLLGLCSFTSVANLTQGQELQLFYNIFKDWISKFDKQYGIEELAIRFMNWKSNYDMVQEHNSKNLTWMLAMNDFGDLTSEEFSALHLGLDADLEKGNRNRRRNNNNNNKNNNKNNTKPNTNNSTNSSLPKSVDWRKEGAVTPVKNQGNCGGCYAFAASGALEGIYAIKEKKLISLSDQQMIDCTLFFGNQGCDGGLMVNTYQYTLLYGVEPEVSYGYAASLGYCRQDSRRVLYRNTGYVEVPANNFTALKQAVAQQPVSVGIEASSMTVQLYKSGVVTSDCSTGLNHAVLLVGYDTTPNGQDYWIVKNSWGAQWGLNGYFHLAMGAENSGAGVCGVNMMASYPTL